MKTFEEIDPHLQIIKDIDQRKDSGVLDRRRAISGLVYRLADELIAGHPAPRSDDPGYFTRIDGLVPALATELVRQHEMAIAHRTHLAERLEADGGENGAKAAAILRGMDAAAAPKATQLAVRVGYECEPFWIDAGKLSEVDLAKLQEVMGQPGAKVDIFRHGLPPYTFYAGPAVAESLEEDQRLKKTAGKFGGVLRPTSECGIISDDMGTSTYTMVGDVNESGHIEWRAGVDVQGQAAAVAAAADLEAMASDFSGIQRAAYEAACEAGNDLARSIGAHIAAEAEAPARTPMDEAHRVKVQFTVCGTPFTAFADDVQIDDTNWTAIKRARKWQKEIRVLLGQEG